jgi:hypothetical protein
MNVPWTDASGTARASRLLRRASFVALAVHLGAHVWMVAHGRFFASEDDAYRVYLSFLLSRGGGVIGRFWPPGQFVLLGGLLRLGVDAALSPLILGGLTLVVTILALRSIAKDLAPSAFTDVAVWGTTFFLLASPLELVLSHSALAEPPSNALMAVAGAGLARYSRTGARAAVLFSAVALALSSWVRYESWLLVPLWPVLTFVVARRRGTSREKSVVDAAVALLSAVGPLGWMCAQAAMYGSPTAFMTVTDSMAKDLEGTASVTRSLATRSRSFVTWAPEILIGLVAAFTLRRPLRPLAGLGVVALVMGAVLGVQIASGIGFATFIIGGHTFDFFSARLVSGFALAATPLAALGLGSLLASARASWRGALGCAAMLGLLAFTPARPLEFVDDASLLAGLQLRRGELDDRVGPGILLVERPKLRPPLGWAAVGVLWQRWDRIVWATPDGASWLMVDPSDVHGGRAQVANPELGDWLMRRGVTAAWTVTDGAESALVEAWPEARRLPIGRGTFLSR